MKRAALLVLLIGCFALRRAAFAEEAPKEPPRDEEGRKTSRVTPGTASRWSNRGAMTPIASEVPLSAELPERAVPKAPGQETPGQKLTGGEDQFAVHISISGYHLETVRQDSRWSATGETPFNLDHDLYRVRTTASYERIAGSDFGFNFDFEYRARSAGAIPTDRRLNAAYLSWGLTDFRRPKDTGGDPSFGIAVGRVVVPEAGFAQADGAALRFRLIPELNLGVFGGVTGDPYKYNWRLHETEDFSVGWITAGAFGAVRTRAFSLDVAGTLHYFRGSIETRDQNRPLSDPGIDRVHAFLDAGWEAAETFSLFLTGWIDIVPSAQPIQNLELAGIWTPSRSANLRVSLARFSTLNYDLSAAYAYEVDPMGNLIGAVNPANGQVVTAPAVDEEGNPIASFDAKLQLATYDQLRVRGGFRHKSGFEPFATIDLLVREQHEDAPDIAPIRLQPALGVLYRNAEVIDANLSVTGIIDGETATRAVIEGGVSKGFFGFTAGADARAFVGGITSLDGGFDLSYTLPRHWFPGRMMLRGAVRYFREDIAIVRPLNLDLVAEPTLLPLVPAQESWLGFGGVDWRL